MSLNIFNYIPTVLRKIVICQNFLQGKESSSDLKYITFEFRYLFGLSEPKALITYEQAFQGLFTTGTSASASGKPKKRSVAKLGLKTIVHAPFVCPQPPCRAQTDKE